MQVGSFFAGKSQQTTNTCTFHQWLTVSIVLEELQQVGTHLYLDPTNVAFVHVGLGDTEQAVDWLNKAYEERAGWMVWLNALPLLDPLRADPRFQALLQKMNFPVANAD